MLWRRKHVSGLRSSAAGRLAVQYLHEITHGVGAIIQFSQFFVGEAELDDVFDARGAELDGDADEEVVYSVLALQVGCAGEDALLVEQDGVDHLGCGCGRRVEGAPALEEADDLGPALTGALDYRLDLVFGEKLRDRDPAYGGHARQRYHRVPVPAEDEREDVAHGDLKLFGYERAVAGRIEDASHADHPLAGEPARLHRHVAHRVERVGDDDEDRLRRMLYDLFRNAGHDVLVRLEQIVTAHSRLAGAAASYDHHVRACGLLVIVGARYVGVVAEDRATLQDV